MRKIITICVAGLLIGTGFMMMVSNDVKAESGSIWTKKTEMNNMPSTEGWTLTGGGYKTSAYVSEGILYLYSIGNNNFIQYYRNWVTNNSVGTTVEAKMRKGSTSEICAYLSLEIFDGTREIIGILDSYGFKIYGTGVYLSGDPFNFHTYRITLKNDIAKVYIDGNCKKTFTPPLDSSSPKIRFGKPVTDYYLSSEWDYVYYSTEGAFPPTHLLPIADAGHDRTAYTNEIVSFDGSSSYGTDGNIINYTWDLGDGNTSYGATTTHAYPVPGVYNVTLTITDNLGGIGTDKCKVTVKSRPDLTLTSADIFFFPENSIEGDLVTINATIYNVAEGCAENVEIRFYCNENMIGTTNAYISEYSQENVSVTWNTVGLAGNHTIRVVADSNNIYPELNETNNEAVKEITVRTAESYIEYINETIQGFPDDVFKNNPEQKKNTFSEKLEEVTELINNGSYEEAINKLEKDIRAKADGYFGGKSNDDWITNYSAQLQIKTMIDNIENSDVDGDCLTFYDEGKTYYTDPYNADTDNDFMPDGWEVHYGLNPLHDGTYVYSYNNDKTYTQTSNPNPNEGADGDFDNDNLTNSEEYNYTYKVFEEEIKTYKIECVFGKGLDPGDEDTDDDGLWDGCEINNYFVVDSPYLFEPFDYSPIGIYLWNVLWWANESQSYPYLGYKINLPFSHQFRVTLDSVSTWNNQPMLVSITNGSVYYNHTLIIKNVSNNAGNSKYMFNVNLTAGMWNIYIYWQKPSQVYTYNMPPENIPGHLLMFSYYKEELWGDPNDFLKSINALILHGISIEVKGVEPLNIDFDHDGLLDGYNVTTDTSDYRFEKYSSSNITCVENPNGTYTFVGEMSMETSPVSFDSDNDGLDDGVETELGLNPAMKDSDNDGVIDGFDMQPKANWANINWPQYVIPAGTQFTKTFSVLTNKNQAPNDNDIETAIHKQYGGNINIDSVTSLGGGSVPDEIDGEVFESVEAPRYEYKYNITCSYEQEIQTEYSHTQIEWNLEPNADQIISIQFFTFPTEYVVAGLFGLYFNGGNLHTIDNYAVPGFIVNAYKEDETKPFFTTVSSGTRIGFCTYQTDINIPATYAPKDLSDSTVTIDLKPVWVGVNITDTTGSSGDYDLEPINLSISNFTISSISGRIIKHPYVVFTRPGVDFELMESSLPENITSFTYTFCNYTYGGYQIYELGDNGKDIISIKAIVDPSKVVEDSSGNIVDPGDVAWVVVGKSLRDVNKAADVFPFMSWYQKPNTGNISIKYDEAFVNYKKLKDSGDNIINPCGSPDTVSQFSDEQIIVARNPEYNGTTYFETTILESRNAEWKLETLSFLGSTAEVTHMVMNKKIIRSSNINDLTPLKGTKYASLRNTLASAGVAVVAVVTIDEMVVAVDKGNYWEATAYGASGGVIISGMIWGEKELFTMQLLGKTRTVTWGGKYGGPAFWIAIGIIDAYYLGMALTSTSPTMQEHYLMQIPITTLDAAICAYGWVGPVPVGLIADFGFYALTSALYRIGVLERPYSLGSLIVTSIYYNILNRKTPEEVIEDTVIIQSSAWAGNCQANGEIPLFIYISEEGYVTPGPCEDPGLWLAILVIIVIICLL